LKIIFVCGVFHSGTTLLDVMLGAGDDFILSCGEIMHYNNISDSSPYKKIEKAIKDDSFTYNLFSEVCDKDLIAIVDSSKNPDWIRKQVFRHKNEEIYGIIIYKHPVEQYYSYYKRNKSFSYFKVLYKWYSEYLSIFEFPIVVYYKDLCKYPQKVLKKLCHVLGLRYFHGKEYFWNFKEPVYFSGCREILLNFLDKSKPIYRNNVEDLIKKQNRFIEDKDFILNHYRTIYYNNSWEMYFSDKEKQKILNTKEINEVFKKLEDIKLRVV